MLEVVLLAEYRRTLSPATTPSGRLTRQVGAWLLVVLSALNRPESLLLSRSMRVGTGTRLSILTVLALDKLTLPAASVASAYKVCVPTGKLRLASV